MPQRLKPGNYLTALLVAVVACGFTYLMDRLVISLNISSELEIANELMIGICAAMAALMLMKYRAERVSRAREKIILVSELNHHIRNAVTLLGQSAALPDSPEKLRMIDAAVDRVDRVLTELVPTANTTDAPRLFLDERPEGSGSRRKR